jgi:hypothetical protein
MGDANPNIYELLAQEKVWCPSDQNLAEVRLKQMTIEHRRNLYRYLMRRAPRLKRSLEKSLLSRHFSDFALDELEHLQAMSAEEWMRDQPLMVRLRKQLNKYDRRLRRAWVVQHAQRGDLGKIRPSFICDRAGFGARPPEGLWIGGAHGHAVQWHTSQALDEYEHVYIYPVDTDDACGVELINAQGKTLNFSVTLLR